MTRWIPVTEKLPEPYTEVLVNITYDGKFEGIDIASYIPDKCGYIDDKWDTQIDWMEGPTEWYHVTAWMPIPEPYKEESEVKDNEN